jgi:hypothetical protein
MDVSVVVNSIASNLGYVAAFIGLVATFFLGGVQISRLRSFRNARLNQIRDANQNAHAEYELKSAIKTALQPDVYCNAEIVHDHLQPISFNDGDSAKLEMSESQNPDNARVLRKFLNVGAMLKKVRNDKEDSRVFYIRADLVKALLEIQEQARPLSFKPYRIDFSIETPKSIDVAVPSSMRSEYYAEMLASIDLDASKFAHLTSQSVGELAKSAGERLSRLAKRHGDIKRMMDAREGDIEARLRGAYNRIWTSLADNPAKIQVLNSVQETIVHYLPALTLRNMLGELIVALEKPAARDDGIYDLEQKLLDQLREIRSVLDGMDLGNEQAWQRLGWMMDQDGAAGA